MLDNPMTFVSRACVFCSLSFGSGWPCPFRTDFVWPRKGLHNILHTRNRHLRNNNGFPVAFSNGLSAAFSNKMSLVCGMFQRIVTCPVDVYWSFPVDFQWHFPMDCYVCDFWRVIFCPDHHGGPQTGGGGPADMADTLSYTIGRINIAFYT